MKTQEIPILDTKQLETELINKGGVFKEQFTANAHNYFHINKMEDYFRVVNFPLPSDLQPKRLTVYTFFFLAKGATVRSNGLDTYHIDENSFFFIPAHQITTHNYIKDIEGYYCHFSLDLLTQKMSIKELYEEFPFLEFNGYPLVIINETAKKHVIVLFERLLTEYKQDKACRSDILSAYLMTLFTELKPFVETSKPKKYNAASLITEQFKKNLVNHLNNKYKITDYAELLNVSPNHLNKCVKQTTGKSAHDLLNEMLLLEAKVLLKQTSLSVNEIAYKIGKNESSDFVRFFKAQTGLRPTEYRLMK